MPIHPKSQRSPRHAALFSGNCLVASSSRRLAQQASSSTISVAGLPLRRFRSIQSIRPNTPYKNRLALAGYDIVVVSFSLPYLISNKRPLARCAKICLVQSACTLSALTFPPTPTALAVCQQRLPLPGEQLLGRSARDRSSHEPINRPSQHLATLLLPRVCSEAVPVFLKAS